MTTEPRPDWAAIERMPEFRALVRAKRAFIIPACVFFVAYYFALPALVGYWPDLMSTRVAGAHQPRLPLRAVAVRHGVGAHGRSTSGARARFDRDGATTSSRACRRAPR